MDVNDPVGPSARGSMAPSTKRGQLAVVFDFDNTLATCDVILSVGSSRETVVQCFGGDERVLLMHRLLEHLEQMGVRMAIVSFNNMRTISRSLELLELTRFFPHVHGIESFPKKLLKSAVIHDSILAPYSIPPAHCCFLDDSNQNISEVRRKYPMLHTVFVESKGMEETHCDALRQWVDAHVRR